MRSGTRLLTLATLLTAAVFASARFSGEKGARAHRIRLAAGNAHACALLDDGTVECWGLNSAGQLGDGTTGNRTSPVPVSGVFQAVSISTRAFHSCAILASGAVRCWGFNAHGELGNGTTTLTTIAAAVSGLSSVVSVAAGGDHACAVRVDGTVWCWGDNLFGQLGIGTFGGTSLLPVQVGGITGAVAIVAGGSHSCALLQNGTVECWGKNQEGQVGNNSSSVFNRPVSTAPLSASPGVAAVDLTAGDSSTCARLSDGSVSCWGDNAFGQVGDGTAITRAIPAPTQVAPSVVALATGDDHTCAILASGTVSCWGDDDFGQLGDGGTANRLVPGPPVPGIASAIEITAGHDFTCVRRSGGAIHCFGDNLSGQHGNGTTSSSGTDSVTGISGTFLGRGVAAGNRFTCGRRGTGEAACWGAGTAGQLGNGDKTTSLNPVAVSGLTKAVGMSAGNGSHACAVDAQGQALCWGLNSHGQLGNGTTTDTAQPVKVSSADRFTAISAGESHTCALTITGLVRCWGANDIGELGNGGAAESHVPAAVTGISNAIAISAGRKFTCALIVDSTVECWGDNSSKQLGDAGTEPFSTSPRTVIDPFLTRSPEPLPLSKIVAVAAGASHACAVTASGNALCWGANSRGQIGNGSTTLATVPTTVLGLSDAVTVSAGAFFTCAVQAGGTASCWGANDSGELADKDSVDHLTPTPVDASVFSLPTGGTTFLALTGVVAIATGTSPLSPAHEQACALLATGVIRCWGDNSQGEIGDGDSTNAARPTGVNSFAANVDPDATLRNGRIAEVAALIDCEDGDNAQIILTLDQGGVSGIGHADARCEGRLVRVPMAIPAQGPSGFQSGPATASVEAIGTHWTRQVVLSISR